MEQNIDENGFLNFNLTLDPNNFKLDLERLILQLRPNWCKEKLRFKEYNGGLTNKLVGVCQINDLNERNIILCRIYGGGTDKYINRDDEVNNMKLLSEHQLGPKVFCKFNNGICYEYMPGIIVDYKLLQNEQVYSKIAQLVATMHLVEPKKKLLNDHTMAKGDHANGENIYIFNKIHELLSYVPDNYETSLNCSDLEKVSKIPAKALLINEVETMQDYIVKYCNLNNSKVVFSHNDLLLGNIIYNKDESEVYFIDYEYSALNWQSYDIANHFNEYAGVDCVDYNLYPSKEYQLKWLEYYLRKFNETSFNDENLNRLYNEVAKFTLVSHLFWGIWSIVQARYSQNDFDFVNYASVRLGEYFKCKNERLGL